MKPEDTQFTFDKFMDDIVVKEIKKNTPFKPEEETPSRKYARLYRELPQNRIKIGAGK